MQSVRPVRRGLGRCRASHRMKHTDMVVEMDDDARSTKVKVHYDERDSADGLGRSLEVVVYVDRRGLSREQFTAAVLRQAETLLRDVLGG